DGSALDPPESQPEPRRREHLPLVHPGGKAQGRGKIDSPKRLAQHRIRLRNGPGGPGSPQQGACQAVGDFGLQQEEQRADEEVHRRRNLACALAQSPSAVDNRSFVQPATPLPGTQDLLFEAANRLRRCEATLCGRVEETGYADVILPAIEAPAVSGPEAFRLLARSGPLTALRPELTAQR